MTITTAAPGNRAVTRLDSIARERRRQSDRRDWLSWANLDLADLELVVQDLAGRHCRMQPRDGDWLIEMGDGRTMFLSVPWRIVTDAHIAFGSDDNGNCFGMDKPLDGKLESRLLLGGKTLSSLHIDPHTADLSFVFGDSTRLDAFNASSGYEGWRVRCRIREQWVWVIGSGGGQIRVVFLNH